MKQKLIPILLFSLLLIGVPLFVQAQNSLSNLNQALRYSRYSRIALKIIPLKKSDNQFTAQFIVEKIEENPDFNTYSFSYNVLGDYNEDISPDNNQLFGENDLKFDTDRHWVFEKDIAIPQNQEEAILLMTVLDTRQGDAYYYHVDLKSPFVFSQPTFGAYYANDVPFDQTYLPTGEALLFKSTKGPTLHGFHYPVNFDVPYPPMETKPAPVPKEIEVLDEGDFLANVPKTLDKLGYYFFQQDTSDTNGVLVKTTHEAYPKVRDWEEMIEMVTYISTRREHEELVSAEDKKKALDQYWFNLTKNPDAAKNLIREYFRQVEFANILFTDFKAGWKTDKGMIYIVMGPPQEVNFFQDREVWTYQGVDESSKIRFTFARVKNILNPHYYTLNRSRAYQPIWFKNISQWRSGKMAF
ncbi:GWxTD domain-containing protein [Algoriphagus faecimaris]|uniref:GWxTD domain-containing protein n=1 Tax=Algoriphagus faecimaris TaxID=686796 RepID=A0A1G6ME68_9BACT|nr:GWxTD domain-containing protein [Algoriphagus faecimaris]SDC53255.1 GWxTD domain-containing protein [Algoriphagus faecimaris]